MVRGFALMGILIMNMPGFGSSMFAEADGSFLWTGQVDRIAEACARCSSRASSTACSACCSDRLHAAVRAHAALGSRARTAVYLRRLLVLAVLGVLHAAVLGRRRPPRLRDPRHRAAVRPAAREATGR
jgi:uncharacterized protein